MRRRDDRDVNRNALGTFGLWYLHFVAIVAPLRDQFAFKIAFLGVLVTW
jgi:hypothetical protein